MASFRPPATFIVLQLILLAVAIGFIIGTMSRPIFWSFAFIANGGLWLIQMTGAFFVGTELKHKGHLYAFALFAVYLVFWIVYLVAYTQEHWPGLETWITEICLFAPIVLSSLYFLYSLKIYFIQPPPRPTDILDDLR